jgi:hypothetical protein
MASAIFTASFAFTFASAFFLLTAASSGAAEKQVDCDNVMRELVNGKSAQEIARNLRIATSTVYDCENANAAKVRGSTHSGVPSLPAPSGSPSPN